MTIREPILPELDAFQRAHPEIAVGVPGGEWHYRETRRDGPVLVLLPGAQATGDMFYRVATALGQELRVITATPPPLADCGAIADSLAQFLDALGLRRVNLLGSSLSGHVLQLFAHRHPARIGKLFLANTFADAAPYQAHMPPAEAIAATPADKLLAGMLDKMLAAPEPEPVHVELKQAAQALIGPRQSPETLRTRVLALRLSGPVDRVPLPADRVVLIDGDDDPVILPAMREQLRRLYAGSPHHVIGGGGHYPYVLRAEQYTAAIAHELNVGWALVPTGTAAMVGTNAHPAEGRP
jgi:maspardin